jgi:HlyD family secretion protein
MSKKLKITLVVVGAVVVLGGGAAAYSSRNRGVVPVIAAKVETQDIVSKVTANGKIQAENRVELSALVMGQIVNLRVKEGDRVKKGDFLLQIDRNRAAADEAGSAAALLASGNDRDSAKTAMEQAERDFQRTRINFEGKIASESDFEKARSTLDGARAAYEAARNRVEQNRAGLTANRDTLSKTTVLSPIDGIVTTSHAGPSGRRATRSRT